MTKPSAQTEADYLKQYDPSIYPRPSASVDTVIFTVLDGCLQVLLVQRAEHPFINQWSLVGGYIDIVNDTDLEATAKRKLLEKTGVNTPYLEQFGSIGNAQRDPRGWSLTTIYFALIPARDIQLQAGKAAADTQWVPLHNGKVRHALAFDHADILAQCVARLRSKVLYTSLPVHLMPPSFTLGELQQVYEIILDSKIDHKSFRRRILNANILKETGEMHHGGRRPAALYKPIASLHTHFFVRNLEGAA